MTAVGLLVAPNFEGCLGHMLCGSNQPISQARLVANLNCVSVTYQGLHGDPIGLFSALLLINPRSFQG